MSVLPPVADSRLLVYTGGTISFQPVDYQGEAASAGTVTVDVARADGTAIATGAATAGASSAPRTYSLAASNNTLLDLITATWKESGSTLGVTRHEVVGGFYFSLAEMEAFDSSLGDITDGGTVQAKAVRVRNEVERECERVTGAAWVPRFSRVRVDGSGTTQLVLPEGVWNPRSVRAVWDYSDATTFTAYTAAELAAIHLKSNGLLLRRDSTVWAGGCSNLVLAVEHGYDRPPEDLRHAAMSRFRWRFSHEKTVDFSEFSRLTMSDGSIDFSDFEIDVEQKDVFRTYRAHSVRAAAVG